ncbi:helix-turn-helix domain-containing protein [Planctomycetota bacterium]
MDDQPSRRCPNERCLDFGKPNKGNIRPAGWSGTGRRIRMLRCRTCGRAFSERAWTPFHGSRLSDEKDMEVLNLYAQGHGIREIARVADVSRTTVRRKVRTLLKLMRMEKACEERAEEQRLLESHMRRLGFVPMTR